MYTRADISMEDRLEILSRFWRYKDEYGYCSELAREWETSRHFIYTLFERVSQALDWHRPGRKADDRSAQAIEHLQQRVQALEAECDTLRGQLELERQDRKERRQRLLLELALCPVSEDKIIRCLGAAFDFTPSPGWVNEQINRAGTAALAIMQREEIRGAVHEMALDEMFRHQQPILTSAQPHTLMAVVPEAAPDRQGVTWQRFLQQYPNLELAISDQGSGLLKGVELQGGQIAHQYDLFHFKRNLHREVRRLEAYCYREIEKVEQARKLIDSPRLLDSARVQAVVEYREKAAALDRTLEAFDWLEVVVAYLEENLSPFDARHHCIRTFAQAQAVVDEGLDLLDPIYPLDIRAIRTLIEEAREGLFTFLALLERRLQQIPIQWRIIEGSRSAVCDALAHVWYWREPAGSSEKGLRKYLAALLALTHWQRRIENFPEVQEQVFAALDQVVRASSAVECLNSIIRPYVSVKKHLNQRFLALIALYWNMHPLSQREGRTPFQECGIDLGTDDWVELLEIEMRQLTRVPTCAN